MNVTNARAQNTADGEASRQVLDARGLLCPLPVIRLQDFAATQPAGAVIDVRCTDPGTRSDIPAWCRINGHLLAGIDEHDDELVITVVVGSANQRRP